jgi:hypothetical protein
MKRWNAVAALALGAMLTACGGGESSADGTSAPGADAETPSREGAASPEPWKPSIRTVSVPGDPCGWVPVPDVEAIIGPLAEPPKKADGCRYTLVVPEAVAAKRAQTLAMQEQMRETVRKAFPDEATQEAQPRNPLFDAQQDPRSYAVTVQVDEHGGLEGDLAADAVDKRFGLPEGVGMVKITTGETPDTTGWDNARRVPFGFSGRVGHIRITVTGEAPDVPIPPMQALAALIRDRIPDLPFAVTNPNQMIQRGDRDPCTLLTRAEAEAALGPLSMEPYRSSSYWPQLAHGQGHACAYFTPGHQVFALSPEWEGGANIFKLEKGIGGLISMALPQENVLLKGPWDQAHVSGATGALLFLKGDRLLHVHYRTSRATRADAVKLAVVAMGRMGP